MGASREGTNAGLTDHAKVRYGRPRRRASGEETPGAWWSGKLSLRRRALGGGRRGGEGRAGARRVNVEVAAAGTGERPPGAGSPPFPGSGSPYRPSPALSR